MFELTLSPSASAFFNAADAPLQRKLDRCFNQLKSNPRRHNNIKPLKGDFAGSLRFRVGDHRVIYRIDESSRTIYIQFIAHRREVYE